MTPKALNGVKPLDLDKVSTVSTPLKIEEYNLILRLRQVRNQGGGLFVVLVNDGILRWSKPGELES